MVHIDGNEPDGNIDPTEKMQQGNGIRATGNRNNDGIVFRQKTMCEDQVIDSFQQGYPDGLYQAIFFSHASFWFNS